MLQDRGSFELLNNSTWDERVKPPNMTKGTLDYPNNMCQSAFDNALSFKSSVSGRGDIIGQPVWFYFMLSVSMMNSSFLNVCSVNKHLDEILEKRAMTLL